MFGNCLRFCNLSLVSMKWDGCVFIINNHYVSLTLTGVLQVQGIKWPQTSVFRWPFSLFIKGIWKGNAFAQTIPSTLLWNRKHGGPNKYYHEWDSIQKWTNTDSVCKHDTIWPPAIKRLIAEKRLLLIQCENLELLSYTKSLSWRK